MKYFKIVVVAVFALVALSAATVDNSPKPLGEKVLNALKKNDVDTYRSYYITPAELKKELKQAVKQPFQMVDDDELIDDYTGKFENAGKMAFTRIRKDGEGKGIVWEKAELDYIQVPVVTVVKEVSQADVFIHFKYDGKAHIIKLKDCMHTPVRGWCLFGEVRFEKAAKQ